MSICDATECLAHSELEYHPFVLSHLAPVLAIHQEQGILVEAFGPLTPLLRHPSHGGPLKPVISRIAAYTYRRHGCSIEVHGKGDEWCSVETRASRVVVVAERL